MDPEPASVAPAGQAGGDTAAAADTPPVLPCPQSDVSLGSPSAVGLSYDELASHHARVRALRKPELVAECHQLGVAGNINVAKATLQSRLLAYYRTQLRSSDSGGAGEGPSDAHGVRDASRPTTAGGLRRGFFASEPHRSGPDGAVRGQAPSVAPDAIDGASIEADLPPISAVSPPSPSSSAESPSLPLSKRPRATAAAFHPAGSRPLSPPARDIGVPPAALSQIDARRRSHALASVRPARLDELLALQGELRRDNLCVRGVPDGASETAEELAGKLGAVMGTLTGGPVPVRDCYRVGRFSPDRPRPVIVRFHTADEKVAVLRAKGVLYRPECPEALHGIRVYHDLSVQQLNWKLRLRKAFDRFLALGIRAVWRKGYRLFALLDGIWTEFYPSSALVF